MLRYLFAGSVFAAAISGSAQAQVLRFDDVPGAPTDGVGVEIGNTYASLGVEFVGRALAFCLNRTEEPRCSNTSWGTGPQAEAARARGTHRAGMYWRGASPVMNRADGFSGGFSFFYSNALGVASAFEIWSELNGTGSMLASFSLAATNRGNADPGCFFSYFCSFEVGSVAFAGVARSVRFTGGTDVVLYDDITFGSTEPGASVPEPATFALLGLGLVGLVGLAGTSRRRRA